MMQRHHSSSRGGSLGGSAARAGFGAWPALPAALCLAAGAALAWQHPLSGAVASATFVAAVLVCARWPAAWLTALPALLPVVGLAPWTGWLTFEEWDLLVLAAAAGGYARLGLGRAADPPERAVRMPLLAYLFVLLYALALLAASWRGLNAAGGFAFGTFQGYREPMNSIRLAKSFFAALMVFPLWVSAHRQNPARASQQLADGMVLGLLGTSLACAWERSAFTDLLNFSTDYRTTALFWEMHVGGAALDGMLALSFPFLVATLLRSGMGWRWGLAAAGTPLAAYAALTTFSRGVYLAVPLGALVTWALLTRQPAQGGARQSLWRPASLTGTALALGFAAAALWMFPSSGYRGLLALLACALLLLTLPGSLRDQPARVWVVGLLGGACLAALAVGAWVLSPRLVYAAFAAIALVAAGAWALQIWRPGAASSMAAVALRLAAFAALLPCMVWVAQNWGGRPASAAAQWVAVLLAAALLAGTFGPARWWPSTLRGQAAAGLSMGIAALVVAAFLAGGYMQDRFSSSREDFASRLTHWRQGLSTLNGWADWTLGRGTGRFVDEQAFVAPAGDKPGDYRLSLEQGRHLSLVAGTHALGWGEMQRVSQRIAAPHGSPVLRLRVRSAAPIRLHFDICYKHLLYDDGCLVKQLLLPAEPGRWQPASVAFDGELSTAKASRLPRFLVFSVASEAPGQRVDIGELDLRDAEGRPLLANGDFSQELAHWFMSSDRHHMPWHMKNLALHVLFEQGAAGLLLLAGLCAGALARTLFGSAREHPLAPAVAGGLAGFLAVGLFDSLLDVPRVAFLFYLLVLLGLTLRTAPKVHAAEQRHPDPGNP